MLTKYFFLVANIVRLLKKKTAGKENAAILTPAFVLSIPSLVSISQVSKTAEQQNYPN